MTKSSISLLLNFGSSESERIKPLYTGNTQGSHRLEKYLNLVGLLEKSLKIKSALKSTGKSLKKP